MRITSMNVVVVDIETTGLSRERHKITEIAAARLINGEVVETFQTLVNPQAHIPSFITKLTGITNEMVQDAPLIGEAMQDFLAFVGDSHIVGHNVSFDYGFLHHNACTCGYSFGVRTICTRKLANRMLPELPSKKLGEICSVLKVTNEQAHRALADVLATAQVFCTFSKVLQEHGMCELDDICAFSNLPTHKVPSTCRLQLGNLD